MSEPPRDSGRGQAAALRVFVGATEAQMLAVRVLQYSIEKHASLPVELLPLHRAAVQIPSPREPRNWPRTPFSFQRFIIPELCGWRGRAVYLDSDMQVFRDIRALAETDMAGADLLIARQPGDSGRRPQFSVMLLDCSRLQWDIRRIVADLDAGRYGYEDLMYRMNVASDIRPGLDAEWNSLESYAAGRTALLHYTDMDTQPWLSRGNPLGRLWCADLLEAVERRVIPLEEVQRHAAAGWIRPSLVYQLRERIVDPLLLPRKAAALDAAFEPPHERLPSRTGFARRLLGRLRRSAARRFQPRDR